MNGGRRRFVNLVERWCRGMYSVRRINPWRHLFYPTTQEAAEAEAANTNKKKKKTWRPSAMQRLPAPSVCFAPSPPVHFTLLALTGRGGMESEVLCADDDGHVVTYDTDSRTIRTMPSLHGSKGGRPICISIPNPDAGAMGAHSLYVMDKDVIHSPDWPCTFEALICDDHGYHRWRWHPLPQPPHHGPLAADHPYITSYTVVGGSTILVSSDIGAYTYSFDTLTRKWHHHGNWTLPFNGKAEYIPDLNLWLGFTDCSPYHLCAADLTGTLATGAGDEPPAVQQHLLHDLDHPEDWRLVRCLLVNLGSGSFCITKTFIVLDEESGDGLYYPSCDPIDEFAVLTGVEVLRCDGDGQLRMIQHKSRRYRFPAGTIEAVL